MGYRDLVASATASVLMGFLYVSPTLAAPQILAVLETDVGVPFVCNEGICKAQLSTYCLQRERPAPAMGAVYLPAVAEDFTLTVNADGSNPIDLPASSHVSFIESRGFMSVAAVILEKDLLKLGGTNAVIKVAANASMLPEPVANDPNPLTEQEIAFATGSLRQQGTAIADRTQQASAARLLARVMQSLPLQGPVYEGAGDTIWKKGIGDEMPSDPVRRGGFTRARDAYKDCFSGGPSNAFGGVRRCLEYKHDDLIRDINIDYWDSRVSS
ncbi:MAG: hypothetical protein HQ483_07770 [Rhodospirillales bacterium]|nr:hypothetical protein [Rhodospirillales bacterium]